MNKHVPAMQQKISEIIEEYNEKLANIPTAAAAFTAAGEALQMAITINGVFGDVRIDTGHVYERDLALYLLRSAWKHVYAGLNMDRMASAADKDRFKRFFEKPDAFTRENIVKQFGDFILKPRDNILRGLAEAFCDLDPAYKSHDKVKIGVAGLPKRVILSSLSGHYGWGRDRLVNILNALAAYQGRPLITYQEVEALLADETALLETKVIEKPQRYGKPDLIPVHARGVRLRRFQNGNGHLFFEKDTLRDINKALAEYYGEVLPDTTDEKPSKPRESTAVSKDLQYYPTPVKTVDDMLDGLNLKGKKVLDPSCGCGRFLDGLRKRKAVALGIEVDMGRALIARANGHAVTHANFLEVTPSPEFDYVTMNPPFYGKHYAKHVRHAFKFLKPGGTLKAILPITAKEHGLLDDLIPKSRHSYSFDSSWRDLPVGSFSESGTNINTTVLTIHIPEKA